MVAPKTKGKAKAKGKEEAPKSVKKAVPAKPELKKKKWFDESNLKLLSLNELYTTDIWIYPYKFY